jgi:hypothetical protein
MDFLRLSQRIMYISPFHLNTPFEASLTRAMMEGTPIEPLYLRLQDAVIGDRIGGPFKIVAANPRVEVNNFEHEGRNRASIAHRLGIQLVPVTMTVPPLKNWYKGYQTFDAIWKMPRIEADILRYLDIMVFEIDEVG